MWPGVSAGVMGVYGRRTGRKLPLGMAKVSSAAVMNVSVCVSRLKAVAFQLTC